MTHEAREKYHAVPRIIDDKLIKALRENHVSDQTQISRGELSQQLKNVIPDFLSCDCDMESVKKEHDEREISFTKNYLMDHRININIRQVF